MKLTRLTSLAAAATIVLASAACSEDEQPATTAGGTTASSAESGDADRYCELVAELDAQGEQVFADVPQDAPPEEYMRREQQLLDQASAQLEELVEVAPQEIRDDVPVFLEGMRARATAGEDPDAAESEAAEERILAWEEENC